MNELELLHVMQKELPSIHRRLTSQDPTVAICAHMRLGDLCEMLQRRVRHAQGPPGHRVPVGFVGLSVGRDD